MLFLKTKEDKLKERVSYIIINDYLETNTVSKYILYEKVLAYQYIKSLMW